MEDWLGAFFSTVLIGYGLIAYGLWRCQPKAFLMRRKVNWERVATLEHDLGYDHTFESAAVCPTPELHRPGGKLTSADVGTLTRALALGVIGPNESRLSKEWLAKDSVGRPARPIGTIDYEEVEL